MARRRPEGGQGISPRREGGRHSTQRRGPGGRFPTGQPERSLSAPSRPSGLLGEGPTHIAGGLGCRPGYPMVTSDQEPLSAGADLSSSPHQAIQGR